MSRLKAIFGSLHAGLERLAQKGVPYVEKILGRLPSKEDIQAVDFATDADLAILRQEPLRARVLLRAIGIVFLLFVVWAALAQLDEVTRGEGKVIPSRQVQILQSIDGGLVSEILVHEGDIVQFDFFRAFSFAGTDVGAKSESFLVHLCNHSLCTPVRFHFALRQ
jgi:adhesin transport system membrane fusion protein